jgi:type IV secretory pathway VirJ component
MSTYLTFHRLRPLLGALALLCACASASATETLTHGLFKEVTIYRPLGEPRQFVLFLSGDGGWQNDTNRMAEVLTGEGAMVAGINSQRLFADLEKLDSKCVFPDGDLENLSHYIQAYYHLSTYHTPVLVGYSAGASLAYAVAAQAPPELFSGVLTLGFSPDLELKKPLCKGAGVHFRTRAHGRVQRLLPAPKLDLPWVNLTGDRDRVCPARDAQPFVAKVPGAQMVLLPAVDHYFVEPSQWAPQLRSAFAKVEPRQLALQSPPSSLADIPVVEVPAEGAPRDLFAVLLSGDGGWAGIDKDVAAALAGQGIAVVGVDSLRYFWTARTPEGLARDLDRTLRYYSAHWHKPRALLVGYSQGADVLPFAVNRLPAPTRSIVALTVLIGLGRSAAFEFHLSNWIGSSDGLPISPETQKLSSASTLCLYGKDDTDSLCSEVSPRNARVIQLPGGHHFGGDYDALAGLILKNVDGTHSGIHG